MAMSLYDLTAPSRRQRERLKGLYEKPKPEEEKVDPTDPLSLYGPERGEPSKDGSWGKDYGSMTATELNDAAKSANSGNVLERNMPTLAGMLGPLGAGFAFSALDSSLMNAALNNAGLPNPGDYVDGKVTGGGRTSMNLSPELMGKNGGADIFAGIDLDLAGSIGESPGLYSKGGKVTKQAFIKGDPPGPDNVIIGAKTGERIINEDMFRSFSDQTRAEIEAALKKVKRK